MILRRITEHVKTQNWFAVGLDFFIVVVGVFVGIQASNWNEAHTESLREASYLAALHEDFTIIVAELESDVAHYEEIADAMTLLLEESRKAAPDSSIDTLNDTTGQLVAMEGTPIVSDTYTNLTGSGDLAIIKNQAVKNAMSAFFGKADVVRLVSNTHELQLVNIFEPYIIANLDYTVLLRDSRGLRTITGFEPDRILTALPTAEFRNVVTAKLGSVTDLRDVLLTAAREARAVEALLAEELERKR